MKLQHETHDDVLFVTADVDRLDANNAEEFKRSSAEAITPGVRLVIDLAGVMFVDSSGLGALLYCLRSTSATGGALKLCGLSPQVSNLFELVRMNRIFDIHKSRSEAVAAFAATRAEGS